MKALIFFILAFASSLSFSQNKNVLFIIVDDLKPTLNSFGESQIISPNIDALAASGVAFTNAHAQQAVCAPSRVSFMTGMRPDYTKVWDLKTKMRDMRPDILTMPQYFKQNGYTTLGLGKVLHGAVKNDAPSWTEDFIEDTDLAYAEGYPMPANKDYQSKEAQALYSRLAKKYPGDPNSDKVWLAVNKEFKELGVRRSTEMANVPDDAYADGAIALRSIEEMRKFQKGKKPFFLTVGFHKPHLPFVAPKKYWDLYDRNEIELATFQEQASDSPEFAYHTFGELKNYSDITEALEENGAVLESKQRELIHGYYASVSYVDAQVGLLMDYLEKSGLKEKTLVVLVGDHGWHLGDHGLWNKHSNFEQATRTPVIIAGAGVKAGIKNASPVELVDVFPTICDFTGQKIPDHLEGNTLRPILAGNEMSVKDFAISQYPRHGERMGYAVRSGRHRYIAWFGGDYENRISYDESQLIAEELYDYETDPLETRSFHNDPQYQSVKAEMKSMLIQSVFK